MFAPHTHTILTTNLCTAVCDHCSVRSDKKRRETLTAKEIIHSINEIHAFGNLKTVVFAGGEPTLLKDDLFESIAHAHCLGLNTRLVTNCSWAFNIDKAKQLLQQLKDSGLHELNLSMDKFHADFIKQQCVANAFNASIGMGFGCVIIATSKFNGNDLTLRDPHEFSM